MTDDGYMRGKRISRKAVLTELGDPAAWTKEEAELMSKFHERPLAIPAYPDAPTTRHPIETLRGLVSMGATGCTLMHEEAAALVDEWDRRVETSRITAEALIEAGAKWKHYKELADELKAELLDAGDAQ